MVKTDTYLITLKANFFEACNYVCKVTEIFRCKTNFQISEMTITTLFSLNCQITKEAYIKEFGIYTNCNTEAIYQFGCETDLKFARGGGVAEILLIPDYLMN